MNIEMKDLLVNLLFVIMPLFIYQILYVDQGTKHRGQYRELTLALIFGLSIILCMSFPLVYAPGYRFDLRHIPAILAFFYIRPQIGALVSVLLLGYRFYLGGGGQYTSLAVTLALALVSILLYKWFLSLSSCQRGVFLSLLSLIGAECTSLISMQYSQSFSQLMLLVTYPAISCACMWVTVYFLENGMHQLMLQKTIHEAHHIKLVSQIAASISHEVRNPLTVTKGFLQLLINMPHLSEHKKTSYLSMSLQELERAEAIITDYLALAKPQLERLDIFAAHKEVLHMANVIRPYAAMQSVEVDDQDVQEAYILGDRSLFRQSLINLMKNGVEAMPTGGTLRIRVLNRGSQVHIEVSDTGIGMSPEQVSRLGTPFYSNKERGTGLGMTLIYNVIRSMNGTIHVESVLQKGTRFSLSFPKQHASASSASPSA